MFRAFNLSSKYGRSKAEKILLTYQTFAISVKVPTPYTTQPPCHNCVAILGDTLCLDSKNFYSITNLFTFNCVSWTQWSHINTSTCIGTIVQRLGGPIAGAGVK